MHVCVEMTFIADSHNLYGGGVYISLILIYFFISLYLYISLFI